MEVISLYWFAHLGGENVAYFTKNLVQNSMNLLLMSKNKRP